MIENKYDVAEKDKVVKLEEWLLFIFMGTIPVINLFSLGYFSFNHKINPNKRNFSRAAFIYVMVLYALIIITFVI